METQKINSLRKLQLAGSIIVAYDGGDHYVISKDFCTRYGLNKLMSSEELNELERIYQTKVVRVVASYELEDRMDFALSQAGYK